MTGFEGQAEGAVILNSSLSVSERYNDNLFFTETDRVADFTTLIMPSLGLTYHSRNLILLVTYRGSAEFHARHSKANIYAQEALFDLDLPGLSRQIKGVDVQVTEEVTYTPELPAFTFSDEQEEGEAEARIREIQEAGEGIQVARTDTFRNRAGVELGYAWSRQLRTTASYTNVITRYSEGDLQDTVAHNGALDGTFHYQSSPSTRWTGFYGISATFFKEDDEVVTHRLGIEVEHEVSRVLSVNGGVGVGFVQGESPRVTSGVQMSRRFKTGAISIGYINEIATGTGVIREATVRQRIFGRATRSLGENISAYVRLAYASNRSLSGDEVDVSIYAAGTGMSIRLLSWLRGGLRYSYLNQQSKGSVGEDGQRNMVTLILTATGPSWRIVQ